MRKSAEQFEVILILIMKFHCAKFSESPLDVLAAMKIQNLLQWTQTPAITKNDKKLCPQFPQNNFLWCFWKVFFVASLRDFP